MKSISKTAIILALIFGSALIVGCAAGFKTSADPFEDLQKEANEMKTYGGWAVVGTAVQSAGRDDQGKEAAKLAGMAELSNYKKQFVEATASRFAETIGVGVTSEQNDVLRSVVETATANIIEGASVWKYRYYESDQNRQEGTKTWGVLIAITPKTITSKVEGELQINKKAEEYNMWQRYMESEAKKRHDEQISKFIERFGTGSGS